VKLSIIIPSFNTEKFLQKCLDSIVRETKNTSYEIIIIDNHSSYDIKKQIQNFKNINIRLIQNSRNVGYSQANNQGIKQAAGDYFLFLNSDTVILNRAIDKTVDYLEKKQLDILGCQLLNKDMTIQPSAGFFPKLRQIFYMMFFLDDLPILSDILKPYHQQNKNFYTKDREVDWVTGAFMLVRRRVIDKIGAFDPDYFMYMEEVDFCYRAKKAGFKILYTPQAEIIHYKEASPRQESEKAILAEIKGLKIFFKKYKPSWELPILSVLLKLGSLLRLLFFGILMGNENKRIVYWQAFVLA